MVTIKQFVDLLQEQKMTNYDIAATLGTSVAMVSNYRNHKYNPSIDVAKRVYKYAQVTLHPFNEESLKYEIERDDKNKKVSK